MLQVSRNGGREISNPGAGARLQLLVQAIDQNFKRLAGPEPPLLQLFPIEAEEFLTALEDSLAHR
jgi:hypothetical protein